jgi:hypothetical protein
MQMMHWKDSLRKDLETMRDKHRAEAANHTRQTDALTRLLNDPELFNEYADYLKAQELSKRKKVK